MSIKIDLRIFLFGVLFFLTKQIELYAILMVFALLHEMAHMCTGLALGYKPKEVGINPFGFKISFYTKVEDYNKKIKNGNEFCIKKIVIAISGPLINLLIALFCILCNQELIVSKEIIIYSNLLLAGFNLLPIYPLDGGRILKEMVHIFKGKEKAYKVITIVSKIIVVLLTVIASIFILFIHNIALVFVLIYLWYLVIKNEKEFKIYLKTVTTARTNGTIY